MRHQPGLGPCVPQACEHCGGRHECGGPMWNGRLHDPTWVADLLALLHSERASFPGYDKASAARAARPPPGAAAPLSGEDTPHPPLARCTRC